MKKIAVITGGASGIGLALAKFALKNDMIVYLCDIEKKALYRALKELRILGKAYAYIVDVSKPEQVREFAKYVFSRVPTIHYLFNNAGVAGALGFCWETPIDVLQHIFTVNVLGVVNCLQAFVPRLLENGEQGHIINMSSNAGVTSMPFFSQYQMTKHSVVTLSESLHYELSLLTDKIKVSVVCPGFIKTNINASSRNYPEEIQQSLYHQNQKNSQRGWLEEVLAYVNQGSDPEIIAKQIFDEINQNHFYIFPHRRLLNLIENRVANMLNFTCAPIASIKDWAG